MVKPYYEPNIHDTETLRAVAHPIRSRILGLLRYEGPATASQLGRRLDESSGSTSYHLRQLARYGFVEEDPDQPNRRDKRWRATQMITSWRRNEVSDDPEWRQISDALERRQLLRAIELFQRWFAGEERFDPRWHATGGLYDNMVRLTPSQLAALDRDLMAVVDRYITAPPPAEPDEPVRHVAIFQQLLAFEGVPL
ncbi:helix-turn-helix domain-containing protein [Phytohabitans sp. ZYX-F-186]|uniref:Helix-turn-helix domain-containing protein n=1 Tax=Phytohabitans maris TaxID=3071409 RepID=A0ABU0ZKT2_9ACTN|nr:helix-turn-helix domain-containing protein [Phytohabitans sp. ZYX-F-186]MDQ7907664.1 helix-turn-helix domain-containing protein [Phytohabitans sp. ZYX-F-186]